jgi:hypothetical protein
METISVPVTTIAEIREICKQAIKPEIAPATGLGKTVADYDKMIALSFRKKDYAFRVINEKLSRLIKTGG